MAHGVSLRRGVEQRAEAAKTRASSPGRNPLMEKSLLVRRQCAVALRTLLPRNGSTNKDKTN